MRNSFLLRTLILLCSITLHLVNYASEQNDEIAELRRTGGTIYKPGSQKGEIVYLNCQNAAKPEWIQFSADYFKDETKFNVQVRQGSFDIMHPNIQGDATLFIIDDAKLPSLLCAPDNRWAMVNVAPLKSDKTIFFEARTKKELSRGVAYLCGAANSQYQKTLTGPLSSIEALDRHADHQLPFDVLMRFRSYMREFNVTPARYTAYINACRQGWAPQPTNEFQKVIWEKVHSIPDKPMKIEFDPATQKGKVTK